MARDSETQTLIARLEDSRRHLGDKVIDLKEKLNVPKQIKRRVAQKPWLWFGGSAAGGLLVAFLLRRPGRRSKKSRSLMLRLLMPAVLAMVKPRLMSLATRELQRRFLPDRASPEKGSQFPVSNS